jgi:hypothetical protein
MEILFEESGTELFCLLLLRFLHNQLPVDLRRFFEVVEKVFVPRGFFFMGKSIKICPVLMLHNDSKV